MAVYFYCYCTLYVTFFSTFQLATTKKLLDEFLITIIYTNESILLSLNALLYNPVLGSNIYKSTETRNPAGAFKAKAEFVALG